MGGKKWPASVVYDNEASECVVPVIVINGEGVPGCHMGKGSM